MSPDSDETGRIDYGRRKLLQTIPLAGLIWGGSGSVSGASGGGVLGPPTPTNGSPTTFPEEIPLPVGIQPEGIVTGRGHEFFVGSLATGGVYRGDLRTGAGEMLVSSPAGAPAVGLSYDSRRDLLFVAGGPTGQGFVYDAKTGDEAATYDFTSEGSFVNDVIVTRTAAYFTDSFRPYLYRVPLGPGGRLPDQSTVEEIELVGFQSVPGAFNANGIHAPPSGAFLIVVNSTTGILYRVEPSSGMASEIDLGGDTLTAGDGILLDGNTLYVVRNQNNLIAVVSLGPGAASGEVVGEITDPDFDVPTTVAESGDSLYAVNARFTTPPTPDTEYDVVRVPKKPNS